MPLGLSAVSGSVLTDAEQHLLDAITASACFAFQPVVNIHTGRAVGFEAFLTNVEAIGFDSVDALCDHAWNAGFLHRLDLSLRDRAIAQFVNAPACANAKIFFNIDRRLLDSSDHDAEQATRVLNRHGLGAERLVFEFAQKYEGTSSRHLVAALDACRDNNHCLAIDSFGRGDSELRTLYDHAPDFIKIDPFFVSGLADDSKKRQFMSAIVDLAHVLGTVVVAKGVERERDFLACRDIGCDLLQGYFVAHPTADPAELREVYDAIPSALARERRKNATDEPLISEHIEPLRTMPIGADLTTVFETFRTNKSQHLFPILHEDGSPAGLLRELDMKEFIYLQYGRDLLQNKAYGRSLKDFVIRCPIADINTEIERVLEMYSVSERGDGILITKDSRYIGFLTAEALLRIINDKNLRVAKDQNPLSNLPGNNSISDYVAHSLADMVNGYDFVYFDFNDFKPFNDVYGFRQGDRAITLFADIMKRRSFGLPAFLGHVGGDDFFIGFRGIPRDLVEETVRGMLDEFERDASLLYSPEDRAAGGIETRDRHGQVRKFALLSCCAGQIAISPGENRPDADTLMGLFAKAKSAAKKSETRLYTLNADGLPI